MANAHRYRRIYATFSRRMHLFFFPPSRRPLPSPPRPLLSVVALLDYPTFLDTLKLRGCALSLVATKTIMYHLQDSSARLRTLCLARNGLGGAGKSKTLGLCFTSRDSQACVTSLADASARHCYARRVADQNSV